MYVFNVREIIRKYPVKLQVIVERQVINIMFKKILSRATVHLAEHTNLQTHYSVGSANHFRQINCSVYLRNPRYISKPTGATSPAISGKYQVITDDNSPIIEHTVDEIHSQPLQDKYPILSDEYDGINLERGQNGVFEVEDLVDLLRRENSKDIFVATVPREINYVDYICIVSGRSKRHVRALAEFVRKVYKKKCRSNDPIPRIEGKDSDEWMALDLGNIALNIFSDSTRQIYDLETLWAVGPEFDEQINKKTDVIDIFENYSSYLKDLKPLS